MTCDNCATLEAVIVDLQASERHLLQEREDLEGEIRSILAKNRKLRQELADARETDPRADEMREVLDYWRRRLNHLKAKVPLSGKRALLVRARLRDGFTVDDLKKAIDGCVRLPYVVPAGNISRRAATGEKHQRRDDLELIFRDEITVERFKGYADGDDISDRSILPAPRPRGPRDEYWQPPAGMSRLDYVLEQAGNLKMVKAGEEWSARCPVHDDRTNSLNIGRGRKGVLVHCHTGCTADDIARAWGMDDARSFTEPTDTAPRLVNVPQTTTTAPEAPAVTVAQVHEWHERLLQHDKLLDRLYEVRGWTVDTLRQFLVGWDGERLVLAAIDPDEQVTSVVRYLPGGKPKTLAVKGASRGLYPHLIAPAGTELWIVEGEPDAITATQAGLTAVGIPGVNGWKQDHPNRFAGHNIVVCFDCDQPGRDAATRVANTLVDTARSVRVVDLDPTRDDGFDLSDAIKDGATAELLTQLAADAPAVHRIDREAA